MDLSTTLVTSATSLSDCEIPHTWYKDGATVRILGSVSMSVDIVPHWGFYTHIGYARFFECLKKFSCCFSTTRLFLIGWKGVSLAYYSGTDHNNLRPTHIR